MWSCGLGEGKTQKWFGHIERMKCKGQVTKMCLSKIKGSNRRGRPPETLKDRVKDYMSERGTSREGEGLKQARRKDLDKEWWRHSCHDPIHLVGALRGSKAPVIDR